MCQGRDKTKDIADSGRILLHGQGSASARLFEDYRDEHDHQGDYQNKLVRKRYTASRNGAIRQSLRGGWRWEITDFTINIQR